LDKTQPGSRSSLLPGYRSERRKINPHIKVALNGL
jgi:hypothetical protein